MKNHHNRIGRFAPPLSLKEYKLKKWKEKVAEFKISGDFYPENWDNIRTKILKRDNNTCQLCFSTYNGESKFGILKSMVIHHINGEKADCDDENLITLCDYCHGFAHGRILYYMTLFKSLTG